MDQRIRATNTCRLLLAAPPRYRTPGRTPPARDAGRIAMARERSTLSDMVVHQESVAHARGWLPLGALFVALACSAGSAPGQGSGGASAQGSGGMHGSGAGGSGGQQPSGSGGAPAGTGGTAAPGTGGVTGEGAGGMSGAG